MWTRPARRSPAGSRRGSGAWGPPRSPSSSGTSWRPPSATPARPDVSGDLTELSAIEIPGHTSSGLGSPDHPMRIMTRRAAGLTGEPWDDDARAQVSAFFDELAPEWHTRTGPARDAVVADALERG